MHYPRHAQRGICGANVVPEAGNAPGERRDQKGEADQKLPNTLSCQRCAVSSIVILEAYFFFLLLVAAFINWNRLPWLVGGFPLSLRLVLLLHHLPSMSHFNLAHDPIDQLYINPLVEQYVYPAFIALAWCNAIELIVLCFNTFKRYAGSYFWSLFVASLGIIPFGLGYFLKIYEVTFSHYSFEIIISNIGWSALVTGQSLVLWSRLHLVLHSRYILRGLLYLIIFDGVLLHASCTALELATNALPDSGSLSLAFGIIERIQLVWFCLQELLISGFYIYATIQLLRLDENSFSRGILTQLIVVNIIIILLDISVVAIQYTGFFTFQVTFKGLVYSIKLKLEYAILGRLVEVAHIRSQMDAARFQL